MSGHGDISMSVRAIKSGAIEFLTLPEQELLDAVQGGSNAIEHDAGRLNLSPNCKSGSIP